MKALVSVLVISVLSTVAGEASGQQRWTATSFATPGSIDEANWKRFIERVNQDAPEVELRALIYGEAGTEESYLSRLRRGRVHISTASFAASAGIVPEVALLSLPYLFDSTSQLDYVVDNHLDPIFTELFDERGLTLLRWLDVGWVSVYGKTPTPEPETLQGLRLRAPSSPAAQLFLKSVGADVAVLPFAEVVSALQTNLIEGGVTSGLMYASLLSEHAPYFTLTEHSYEVGFLLANTAWLSELSPKYQALVRSGFPVTSEVRLQTRRFMEVREQELRVAGNIVDLNCGQRRIWKERTARTRSVLLKDLGETAENILEGIENAKKDYNKQYDSASPCGEVPGYPAQR